MHFHIDLKNLRQKLKLMKENFICTNLILDTLEEFELEYVRGTCMW